MNAPCDVHRHKKLLCGFLADADRLAFALACAGVGAGALATDRQSTLVALAAITVDRLQALDVALQLASEVTLDFKAVLGNQFRNFVDLLFGQFAGASIGIELGFFDKSFGAREANTVERPQRLRKLLVGRNFYT